MPSPGGGRLGRGARQVRARPERSRKDEGHAPAAQIFDSKILDTFDTYVLFLLIVLPLVGAGLLMLVPGRRPQTVRWVAAAFGLAAMLLSFYTFFFYDHEVGGLQFARTWGWLSIPGPCPWGESSAVAGPSPFPPAGEG